METIKNRSYYTIELFDQIDHTLNVMTKRYYYRKINLKPILPNFFT